MKRHMTYLASGVDACIKQLLERTETQHGKMLVSHAFAYITASKEGLTESEEGLTESEKRLTKSEEGLSPRKD